MREHRALADADGPTSGVAEPNDLAHTYGMIAFDAYEHDDARRVFRLALPCADDVGNWQLRAKVYSSMARPAIWVGEADDGLTYAEHPPVRSDRLTATGRAMLHTA